MMGAHWFLIPFGHCVHSSITKVARWQQMASGFREVIPVRRNGNVPHRVASAVSVVRGC